MKERKGKQNKENVEDAWKLIRIPQLIRLQ